MRVTMAMGKAKGFCTRRSYIGLWLAAASVLWGLAPVAAQAAPAKRYVLKHGRCKAHYVKRREKVKRREHGKLRVVAETFCVHTVAKSKVPTHAQPYTPATPPPTRTVGLHSHLDPSFVRVTVEPACCHLRLQRERDDDQLGGHNVSRTQSARRFPRPVLRWPAGVLDQCGRLDYGRRMPCDVFGHWSASGDLVHL